MMTARLMTASLLAAGALLAGCQSTVPGQPKHNAANPTEPSFSDATADPVDRPLRRRRVSAPTAAPTPAEALPSENGWSFIETKSGKTRCQLSREEVGLRGAVHQFTDDRRRPGQRSAPDGRRSDWSG